MADRLRDARATDARLELAESLLREAVFASRATQAGAKHPLDAPTNCGLGEHATLAPGLSPRAREIALQLFRNDAEALERARAVLAEWVERQDQLDRRRNHFLKDFRQRHGFDRTAYTPDLARAFDDGLAKINGDENAERSAAARRLLA